MGDWSLGLADVLKADDEYYKLTKESMFSRDGAPNARVEGERASDAETDDSDQPRRKPGRKPKHSRVVESDSDTDADDDEQPTRARKRKRMSDDDQEEAAHEANPTVPTPVPDSAGPALRWSGRLKGKMLLTYVYNADFDDEA